MSYKGYNNFTELTVDKTETVMAFGIDIIGFISRHTLGFAIGLIILFILFKWLVAPMIKPGYEDDPDYDLED